MSGRYFCDAKHEHARAFNVEIEIFHIGEVIIGGHEYLSSFNGARRDLEEFKVVEGRRLD